MAKNAIDRYCELDATFPQSRECQLLRDLQASVEEGDAGKFSGYIAEFDRMTKLDSWKTTILLRIKRTIAEEPSLT
jgi:alpha-soluble NSF attachment protein